MNINKLLKYSAKPALYEKGTAVMWTDKYIAKQLLNIHINPDIDLASRKMSTVEKTVQWILSNSDKKQLKILDLGCGPGLYDEKLAKKGHAVTGVDFSKVSIEYAKEQAQKKKLNITYVNANYLNLDFKVESFDLVILIYTDFGVLFPEEREILLHFIYKILKSGGVFIFDVLNDKDLEKKISPKNWEISEKGFWEERPYLVLSESFLYKEQKVVLSQHAVIEENENVDVYRFWTHFFSHIDLTKMLAEHHFKNLSFHEDVLPNDDIWSGDNVTFCKAYKG